MSFSPLCWFALLFILLFLEMLFLWWIQYRRFNSNHVDLGWALSVGLAAIYWSSINDGDTLRRIIVGTLAFSWSIRLSFYLFKDRVWGKPEDSRYSELRKTWGQTEFFIFFQVQAVAVLLFSIPFFVVAKNPVVWGSFWDWMGVLILVGSVFGESIADYQLSRFKSKEENRTKVCQDGLWRYSRHPNYFFECLHWLAYVFFSVGYSYWYLSLIGPILMFIFIYCITGIPYAEKQSLKRRGDSYREYQRTTSPLIPWFPKEKSDG